MCIKYIVSLCVTFVSVVGELRTCRHVVPYMSSLSFVHVDM